jgi:FkbM family methyltransferase
MFSQNSEEKYILEYFGDKVGTFIDIGCNDGVTFSNTRALALKGWSGIFVDPNKEAMNRCKALYKGYRGFYFYEVAIKESNGKNIKHDSGSMNGNDIGLVSTYYPQEMERFKKVVGYTQRESKITKWKTFLNMKPIKEFDFVSIDVEGDEMNILPEMDLSKTSLLCIEWNGHDHLKKEFEYYLKDFKLIYTSGENLLYGR